MNKKSKAKSKSNLGRALINDRFSKSNSARRAKDSTVLHSSEVQDGYEWGRLNLQSVTEESSFQEFLSTAQLVGTEFQAEKLNITFVNPLSTSVLLTNQEKEKVDEAQKENKHYLSIPRRPKWNENTTPEQLAAAENEEFLEWRRRLAMLQEEKGLLLTPYEKNLEFWRQLWRVVERSDVVVQIVDARNPLLFRCEDLEKYVSEVSPNKTNLILLNKADFLTTSQRQTWAKYFGDLGIHVAFFSAKNALEDDSCNENHKVLEVIEDHSEDSNEDDSEEGSEDDPRKEKPLDNSYIKALDELNIVTKSYGNGSNILVPENSEDPKNGKDFNCKNICEGGIINEGTELLHTIETQVTNKDETVPIAVNNSHELLGRQELILLFRTLHNGTKVTPGITTIGLVGYPNVGKSSTINSLLMEKKVSVSATPGKTKHFQTLYLDKDVLLCDCPGLVMPSFVFSKAEMIVNGILPIDQMRDHVPPITLVASVIPRHILEDTYGIMIPPPREGEDPNRAPSSEELLNAYGYNRGFMTQNGQPNNPRSSRYILKDFVTGKLLYCHAPPGYSQEDFHVFPERKKTLGKATQTHSSKNNYSLESDKRFLSTSSSTVHTKGNILISGEGKSQSAKAVKPWKDHKAKRNKREKLRRLYSYLDK